MSKMDSKLLKSGTKSSYKGMLLILRMLLGLLAWLSAVGRVALAGLVIH